MKSAKIKIIISSILLLLMIGAVSILGIYPEAIKFTQTQKELAQKRTELESAEFKLSELNNLQKDSINLVSSKEFVLGLMPDNKNTSDFVVKTEALSDDLSVIINNLTTASDETTTKKPATTPDEDGKKTADQQKSGSSAEFSITTNTSYSAAYDIIKKLESFPRFNLIDSIYLSNFSKDTNTLDFRALGRIFYGK